MDEQTRRHFLKPEHGLNPRKRQPEYKAGKQSCLRNESRSFNPHPEGSLSEELWLEGWYAAKERQRRESEN